jgi:hypothetical protein
MSVAVIKQQSTLDQYGFGNSFNSRGLPRLTSTPPKPSIDEQAENVKNYLKERQMQDDEVSFMAESPKQLGDTAALYQGDDLGMYGEFADFARGVLRGGDQSEYPDYLDESINWKKLPYMRDYFSRQSTLPEHMWDLTTEGEHFDKEGNILPGAIPPVNAVKLIGGDHLGRGGAPGVSKRVGYGLVPNIGADENKRYEDSLGWSQPIFPLNQGVGFVSPPYRADMRRTQAANVSGGMYSNEGLFGETRDNPENRLVGIRGFGVPQDKAFIRPSVGEGREGAYTATIPPERLVGVFNRGKQDERDFPSIEDEASHLKDNEQIRDFQSTHLPKVWEGGRFGLDNPAYTDEEKELITREIEQRLNEAKESQEHLLSDSQLERIEAQQNKAKEGSLYPTNRFDFARDVQ